MPPIPKKDPEPRPPKRPVRLPSPRPIKPPAQPQPSDPGADDEFAWVREEERLQRELGGGAS